MFMQFSYYVYIYVKAFKEKTGSAEVCMYMY